MSINTLTTQLDIMNYLHILHSILIAGLLHTINLHCSFLLTYNSTQEVYYVHFRGTHATYSCAFDHWDNLLSYSITQKECTTAWSALSINYEKYGDMISLIEEHYKILRQYS